MRQAGSSPRSTGRRTDGVPSAETGRVKSRKQAIAVALSKADGPGDQARKARRSSTGPTKSALYEEAKRRGIAGRSRIRKSELMRALGH